MSGSAKSDADDVTDVRRPTEAYEALATEQAQRWRYDETLDDAGLAAYIRRQADDPNVRADVEAVWRFAVTAERERVRQLLVLPLLQALRAIPDGEIRNGCVVTDGGQVRERLRAAYRAVVDGEGG